MAQPQPVQVTLTPLMNGGSFSSWDMTVNGKTQVAGHYPQIDVTYGKNAVFTFTIQNPPGQTITFASILVPAENKEIHSVTGLQTSVLTFEDHNHDKGSIPYEILFNGAGKLDPIIGNSGGGPPLYSYYALAGIGVLAAAAFIFFIVRPLFRRRGA